MNLLVIGAGWYGCHLSEYLKSKGHSVTLVDKTNNIFEGSSSKNQNRLHLGFHYPRSLSTINECRNGFYKFKSLYNFLLEPISNNFYFISEHSSNLGMSDYLAKFEPADYSCCTLEDIPLSIKNVNSTVLRVKEEYINPVKAAEYFKKQLSTNIFKINDPLQFSSIKSILNAIPKSFDYVVNCSFNHLEPIEYDHYELYVSFLYKIDTKDTFAYTIMDGEFFSIYPYDIKNHIYTVTSVRHGVLLTTRDTNIQHLNTDEMVNIKRQFVENDIQEYIPDWNEKAEYVDYFMSWKTKPKTTNDDRSLRSQITDNVISFYGGKITGVFNAQDVLESVINSRKE